LAICPIFILLNAKLVACRTSSQRERDYWLVERMLRREGQRRAKALAQWRSLALGVAEGAKKARQTSTSL
jgi:hypothetical protein